MGLFVRDSRSQSTAEYPTPGHGITWRQTLKAEVSQNTHPPVRYVTYSGFFNDAVSISRL